MLVPDDTSSGSSYSLSSFQVRLIAVSSLIVFCLLFAVAALSGLWAYSSSQLAAVNTRHNATLNADENLISLAGMQSNRVPGTTEPARHTPATLMSTEQNSLAAHLSLALGKVLSVGSRGSGREQVEENNESDIARQNRQLVQDVQRLGSQLTSQRQELENLRKSADGTMHALGVRVGSLQAHITRLNALGQRLTQNANLTNGEFDFDAQPAMGGSATTLRTGTSGTPATDTAAPVVVSSLRSDLQTLERDMQKSHAQLEVLEVLLRGRRLEKQSQPAGWPAEAGWISSGFGERSDPFTGVRSLHKGIDIAAATGTIVKAAASGLVTESGNHGEFGNIVEISHGSGYTTRYAHNHELLVKKGDFVVKGERIATMGNTGRSTGSHLHFEVIEHGKAVDPQKYLESQ